MLTRVRAYLARRRATLTPILNLMLFAVAIWVVNRVLAEYRYDEIVGALAAVPAGTIALTLLISAVAYLALVGYDYLAFRFAGHPLPLRSMLIPSFVAWAVSNTAPASVLTGGGLRYRLYAGLGLTPAEAAVPSPRGPPGPGRRHCREVGRSAPGDPRDGPGWFRPRPPGERS